MFSSPLALIIILLAVSVFVVTLARRLGLPTILGYVAVGLAIGPHALGVFPESDTTHLLAELGVVFLLFTLGLEFSWPRMVAICICAIATMPPRWTSNSPRRAKSCRRCRMRGRLEWSGSGSSRA